MAQRKIREVAERIRSAEAAHRILTIASLCALILPFIVRSLWGDFTARSLNYIPHPYAALAPAVILSVGTVLMWRAAALVRRTAANIQVESLLNETTDEATQLIPYDGRIEQIQLIGTAVVGIVLVSVIGWGQPSLDIDTLIGDIGIWPVIVALTLSESIYLAWAQEGVVVAKELADLSERWNDRLNKDPISNPDPSWPAYARELLNMLASHGYIPLSRSPKESLINPINKLVPGTRRVGGGRGRFVTPGAGVAGTGGEEQGAEAGSGRTGGSSAAVEGSPRS
jgi:hypothetical protein